MDVLEGVDEVIELLLVNFLVLAVVRSTSDKDIIILESITENKTLNGGYLLLVQLHADLAADALQLPPVRLVQGLNLTHIVRRLHEGALRVLLRVEDSHHELQPVVEMIWLNQERQELKRVCHVENLGNADHDL